MKTAEQFAREYMERSGMFVIPCDCGEPECEGWQVVARTEYDEFLEWESAKQAAIEKIEPDEYPNNIRSMAERPT